MNRITCAGLAFLSMVLAAAASTGASPGVTAPPGDIGEHTVWDGSYRLESIVMVREGTNLTIRAGSEVTFPPGTRLFVNGSITVDGTAESPVRFIALPGKNRPAEGGIVLSGKGGENLFRHTIHSGSDWALRAIGDSTVRIERAEFRGNTTAIEMERKGRLFLSDSLFEKNGSPLRLSGEWQADIINCEFREGGAMEILQGRDVVIADSRFHGLDPSIKAQQVIGMRVERCTFDGGGAGIVSGRFSDFRIRCNSFRNLKRALVVRQISKAAVEDNLFTDNETAVTMNNRGGGGIVSNDFRNNGTAVFLDLSSYPAINGNTFDGNALDIGLGKFMSADWEERYGSRKLSQEVAAWVGSRHLDQVGPAVQTGGEVDARDNWWGEKTTADMESLGPEADIKGIDDWFDMKETTYKEFGEETFRIDRVVYSPWKTSRETGTATGSGRCAPAPADTVP